MTGWPWPLDGVQKWFETLWNSVSSWVYDAANSVGTFIWDKILWVKDRIFEGFNWIRDQVLGMSPDVYIAYWTKIVNDNIAAGRDWYTGLPGTWWYGLSADQYKAQVGEHAPANPFNIVASVGSFIWDKVTWLRDRIGEGWASLSSYVLDKVLWLKDQTALVFSSVASFVWDKVVWLQAQVSLIGAGISSAISGGLTWVNDQLSNGLSWINDRLGDAAITIQGGFVTAFQDIAGRIGGAVAEGLGKVVGFIVQEILPAAEFLFNVVNEKIVEPALRSLAPLFDKINAYISAGLQSFVSFLVRPGHKTPEIAAAEMPILLAQITLTGVGVAGILSVAQTELLANKLQLSPLVTAIMPMIPSAMVANAYIGTAIQIGYVTPLRYYYNSLYTPMIPGSGDLIRFVVREVITPGDFTTYMAYEGYSSYWAEAYWRAHWVLPPLDRVYDAFHRGLVDEGYVRSFLVLADYEPKYHDLLLGTLYTLIPRVDLRYGWETGALDDEQLYRALRKHGFNDEDARAEMTIQKRRILESELSTLRSETINDYVNGFIDEGTLSANLAATGLRDELVAYRVEAAKLKRMRTERQQLVANNKTVYMRGGYAVSDAINDLKTIGLTQEEAVSTVQAWEIQRGPARKVEAKKPGEEVSAQLTLNERYTKVISGEVKARAEKGLDVSEAVFLLERGEAWSKYASGELTEGRISVALDMARYAESQIKSADTSLKNVVLKAQAGGGAS